MDRLRRVGAGKSILCRGKNIRDVKVQREVIKNVLFGVYRSWEERVTRGEVRKVNRIQICGVL